MQRSIALLSFVLAAAAVGIVPPTAAQAAPARSPAKIVIVVGATHGATATYRRYADAAYAEAIRYTPNVFKVYSPTATWSKVRSTAVGASVLIYFGHGNGWPSPYAYDPRYTTKNGMGLNYDNNGDGRLSDYENRYYGEPYVKTLDLAPNALVMLHHLCYASGNSEPGHAQPTMTVARQRISNYAAGFLQSNAQAVLADGRRGPVDYIRALFTTDQTVESMWRTSPGNNGHVSSFTSTRTSGVRALMDPEGTSSGFYRSLVTAPNLTTTMVTGVVDTSRHPGTFVVPGRAAVRTEGAPLYPDASAAATGVLDGASPLPAGTRLIVAARSTLTAPGGVAVYTVEGLDDPSRTGSMRATDLLPRDSAPPRILSVAPASPLLSPNGDGAADTAEVTASLSETADWRFRVLDGDGATVHETSGSGSSVAATWDGLVSGSPIADGTYAYRIDVTDPWAHTASRTGSIRVDTTAPSLSGVTPDESIVSGIAPDGDGIRDTAAFSATTSEAGSVVVHIRDADGTVVRSFSRTTSAAVSLSWDGRANDGSLVPNGIYEFRLTPRDAARNSGTGVTRSVRVAALVGHVANSKTVFYPHDRDDLATGTALSFRVIRPATITWTIRDGEGNVVLTLADAVPMAPGTVTRPFYGKLPDGTLLPAGRYLSYVSATDGSVSWTQAASFEMNAFSIRPAATSATRGRSIRVDAVSAETLSTTPRLYVTQPGKATWSVPMTRVTGLTYRATVTMQTGGPAGDVTLKVVAYDSGRRAQRTSRAIPLH